MSVTAIEHPEAQPRSQYPKTNGVYMADVSPAIATLATHIPQSTPATEPHFTPEQVAELWHLDPNSIRRIFRNEDGVLCFGRAVSTRTKRAYTTLRIPPSVLERVHRSMLSNN